MEAENGGGVYPFISIQLLFTGWRKRL